MILSPYMSNGDCLNELEKLFYNTAKNAALESIKLISVCIRFISFILLVGIKDELKQSLRTSVSIHLL